MTYAELTTTKARTDFIREAVAKSEAWALRGLWVIYQNQTADERNAKVTTHQNGIGFTGADADLLTSFCHQLEKRGFKGNLPKNVPASAFLSPKQLVYVYKKMPKYARQLVDAAK